MKSEFEALAGPVSDANYKVIDRVYTFHPSISEVEGKRQIAGLYKSFGMRVRYALHSRTG
ncbi:MAG TPA: hypothetical protein DIC60_01200 [Lachnospiraceae bacterium]|nr:hypothetical protein [Lachnospiraceae bacterium]